MSQVRPVFIFSLPRSGSTLLQRILGAHPAISTMSEPWLLLPLLSAPRNYAMYAEYDHREYVKAMEDFCARLPGGRDDYRRAVRTFALQLYGRACSGSAVYFLDKTPRYHLIAKEILEVFPEGKFIFLWRNPLAVSASMMQTWSGGRWNLYRFKLDLYQGLANLVDVYRDDSGKSCSIRYEDLIAEPETQIRKLLAYLDLPYDPAMVGSFNDVGLEGRMGDPTGVRSYDSVTRAPLEKWLGIMNNPLRRSWARRYLAWIGEARLATMGYSMSEIMRALDGAPRSLRFLGSDLVLMSVGPVRQALQPLLPMAGRPRIDA